ncbi:triose-phosphate isomerase [Virgibacillus byunsanensis]|uniref:Triosephosphate isomerase n=1 Tax=Virgibacillus byunsanensis TaxID=570945 RepID=A0ABW3LRJ9_9BACI
MNHTVKSYISTIVREVIQSELENITHLPTRRKLVVANWKMNMNVASATSFVERLSITGDTSGKVVICPPFPLIYPLRAMLPDSSISIGAQNVHWEDSGAFTGQVSANLLKELDCKYVLIGHSEVREAGETDGMVNQKVKQSVATGIDPIICVGETHKQREQGKTNEMVKGQILKALSKVDDISNVIIAYVPIWAIGTGLSAEPEQAQVVHHVIRETLHHSFGEIAEQVPILYGGSVNQKNAHSLSEMKDIDGALVGGASLDAENFSTIVHAFE